MDKRVKMNAKSGVSVVIPTKNEEKWKRKLYQITFLPSVKTLTKETNIFFLLAQVFFFPKKEKVL